MTRLLREPSPRRFEYEGWCLSAGPTSTGGTAVRSTFSLTKLSLTRGLHRAGIFYRAKRAFLWCLCLVAMPLSIAPSITYADVGVVLNESLDSSVARVTGSGHTAVYF